MILLIKYMVQTVRVFVHPVLLSLSRGKRLYSYRACSYDPAATQGPCHERKIKSVSQGPFFSPLYNITKTHRAKSVGTNLIRHMSRTIAIGR